MAFMVVLLKFELQICTHSTLHALLSRILSCIEGRFNVEYTVQSYKAK